MKEGMQGRIKRWRLILGPEVDRECGGILDGALATHEERLMDEALSAIYSNRDGFEYASEGGKSGGRQKSSPYVARWLSDIRTLFSEDLVSVIQSDAINRKGMKELLFEPETLKNVKPDVSIVSTLISLKGRIPERAKEAAREVVRKTVEDINKRLESELQSAVTGAINRRERSYIPSAAGIDWKTTIRRNIKNYSPDQGTVIPERFFFFDRSRRRNRWNIIVDMDQSGSMSDSVVYGTVMGCVFSSMSSVTTRVVAFDTEVADLTDMYGSDPVDMLFGVQLGGGTDINKSVAYCQNFITDPSRTLFILISDLYEGGNLSQLLARYEYMVESGVKAIVLLALSDHGVPSYDTQTAKKLSDLGVPCFACTPNMLPAMIEGALKGRNLMELAKSLKKDKPAGKAK